MHFGASWDRIESPQVNWKTDGILTLFKHISEANPASYLNLLVKIGSNDYIHASWHPKLKIQMI